MRSAALLESWKNEGFGTGSLWGDVDLGFARARLDQAGVPVTRDCPSGSADRVLVCDDYDPGIRHQASTTTGFALCVCVDDVGAPGASEFDVIWNPNAYAADDLYADYRGELIAGPRHVPLRSDLPAWTGSEEHVVAVMMGGGYLVPHLASSLARLGASSRWRFAGVGSWVPKTWAPLPAESPWSEASRCSRLITSAGTTTWEAACIGIPTVLIQVADNQHLVCRWASAHGARVVDALTPREGIAADIATALEHARPLPPLMNGAPRVARTLYEMILARLAGHA